MTVRSNESNLNPIHIFFWVFSLNSIKNIACDFFYGEFDSVIHNNKILNVNYELAILMTAKDLIVG